MTDEQVAARDAACAILRDAVGGDAAVVDVAIEQAIARMELVPGLHAGDAVETVMAMAVHMGLARRGDLRGFI